MSRIPQNFLDDLLNRLDIVDIVDQRVKLKRTGKNYSACCPFHDEKTPSFTVSPDKQFYYCFGCGASGTAISFLMEYDRVSFVDAVESLAKTAGVEVPREERQYDDKKERLRRQCYELLEKAAEFYADNLRSHPQRTQAVKYLQNRGLSGQIAKNYGMGYAASGWDNLLLKFGQNESAESLLIETGLVIDKIESNKRYDRFRNRIMYPIRDVRGRVIGFGGRVLGDDKPKYLNSPETEVFSKGRELYGLYEAKQANRNMEQLIVVEGYMDVIALAQYGLNNAVATLGTACGKEHLQLAFKHVNEVIFCFDGDNAGRNAAKRALLNSLSSMEDGRQIRFLFLPEGQDPDSLVRQIGQDRFKAQLNQATPLEEFLFDIAAEDTDLSSMDGRARFSKAAAPLIHQLPEGVFQSLMFDNLAKRTGLSLEVLSEFTKLPEDIVQAQPEPRLDSSPPTKTTPATVNYIEANPELQAEQHVAPKQISLRKTIASASTKQKLSPARRALILLLDEPQLLQHCEHELNLSNEEALEPDAKNLADLIRYLKKRPQANFNNIMGFWGGAKGVDAQQRLLGLTANQIFGSLKNLQNYQPLIELQAAIAELNKNAHTLSKKEELTALMNKGLNNLSTEEKQRYSDLIKAI